MQQADLMDQDDDATDDLFQLLGGSDSSFQVNEQPIDGTNTNITSNDSDFVDLQMYDVTRKFPPCPKCSDGGVVHPGGGGSASIGDGALGSKHSYHCTACDCQWQENTAPKAPRTSSPTRTGHWSRHGCLRSRCLLRSLMRSL